MSIVYQPEPEHYCGPNRYGYWTDFPPSLGRPVVGTVYQCRECHKSWVAYEDPRPGGMGLKWRREGWWERRRRVRRQRRVAGPTRWEPL
jgi:hypothetical protein